VNREKLAAGVNQDLLTGFGRELRVSILHWDAFAKISLDNHRDFV